MRIAAVLAAVMIGSAALPTVTAFARLLHKGTTLHVWNVDITNTAGELISNVRVTNYVIKSKK